MKILPPLVDFIPEARLNLVSDTTDAIFRRKCRFSKRLDQGVIVASKHYLICYP